MDISKVNLELDLTYSEYPIRVFDQRIKLLEKGHSSSI
jgi:hypothetical protein